MHYITFADEDNVVHLLPLGECHCTALRHKMCVIYRGQVFNVRQGTDFTAGDLPGTIQNFSHTAKLLASQAEPPHP